MVRTLILYYLSIKSTHGYEIQKFIQISGIENWTKIQSGSIYYALGKLEKEGLITLVKEEKLGARIRKIYGITQEGKVELKAALKEELSKEIISLGSDKLFIHNMINKIDKEEVITIAEKHIKELKEKQSYWRYWKDIKINEKSLVVDKIAFDMNISSLDYQVSWHEALIENIDEYIDFSNRQEDIIRNVDFGEMEENKGTDLSNGERRILKLREEIIDNSGDVKGKIDELITLLSKKS
ncbi:PadR family transcriptional regulator [Clostridium intestinale URNW]|uniref:PadR family transcriptional regulator n=2 Tax=Clostridium intestinale TaxID=36845 RepID=U2N7V3_9CLOT|nr:PadR family transcriptional regulator [Clostridium intestinale URNW]QLY82378.1 PadR family transcriptional regulator [Clostridium intestinale]